MLVHRDDVARVADRDALALRRAERAPQHILAADENEVGRSALLAI